MRIQRMMAQRDFEQAHEHILAFFKFLGQHEFLSMKLEVELMQVQIYIELGDFS